MKITTLPKPGRRFIRTIYVDDEPWIDVHTKIFGFNVMLPECVSLADLQEKFVALEYAKAKKYALGCLSQRSYPSSQLKKLLEKNLISSGTTQKILLECTNLGYINDAEWMERFIKAQINRHVGPKSIVCKLMSKGLSQKEAEHGIEKFSDSEATIKGIQHLLKTKYKNRELSDYREKQKVFAALVRRGFSIEVINLSFKTALDCE